MGNSDAGIAADAALPPDECDNGMGDVGEVCDDGMDNDCDGDVDEPGCREGPAPVEQVNLTLGGNSVCVGHGSGEVWCWGENGMGQLGDGSTSNRLTPISIPGLSDIVELRVGPHTCGRRASGEVLCWGRNGDGELGDGTTSDRLSPTLVSGLNDCTRVSVGGASTCALRSTGQVMCWGVNVAQQLGDDTRVNSRPVPAAVTGLTNAVGLDSGPQHACAVLSTGEVTCWGLKSDGQLGGDDGVGGFSSTRVMVPGIDDAVEVHAGSSSTCARQRAGTVMCWGRNGEGQLGDGSVTVHTAPVQVSGLDDAIGLALGSGHACALRRTGAIACWGSNQFGQLGDGSDAIDRTTPVPVSGLTDMVELVAEHNTTCARRRNGDVYCWGANSRGQFGNGTDDGRLIMVHSTPALVPGIGG